MYSEFLWKRLTRKCSQEKWIEEWGLLKRRIKCAQMCNFSTSEHLTSSTSIALERAKVSFQNHLSPREGSEYESPWHRFMEIWDLGSNRSEARWQRQSAAYCWEWIFTENSHAYIKVMEKELYIYEQRTGSYSSTRDHTLFFAPHSCYICHCQW